MAMTRHFIEVLIREKKWHPYIESHWMDFNSQRGGSTITFREQKTIEFKCSNKAASEILALADN